MQEANDQNDSNRQEPKAYILETYKFLQLHVVLIDSLHIELLRPDRLIDRVQLINHLIYQLMILLLGQL